MIRALQKKRTERSRDQVPKQMLRHVLSNDTQKSKDRRQSLGSDGLQSLTMDSDKLDLGSDAEAWP